MAGSGQGLEPGVGFVCGIRIPEKMTRKARDRASEKDEKRQLCEGQRETGKGKQERKKDGDQQAPKSLPLKPTFQELLRNPKRRDPSCPSRSPRPVTGPDTWPGLSKYLEGEE